VWSALPIPSSGTSCENTLCDTLMSSYNCLWHDATCVAAFEVLGWLSRFWSIYVYQLYKIAASKCHVVKSAQIEFDV
jgi:hypothetical protein